MHSEIKCEIEVGVCGDGSGEFTALLRQEEHRVFVNDVHGDDSQQKWFLLLPGLVFTTFCWVGLPFMQSF